ncbi:MAG: hypothetical protein R3A79_08330 [Nannocystaceae bacterium]
MSTLFAWVAAAALVAAERPPIAADADGDGVADEVEDADLDGRVDPGESDPRRPGLWPGRAPHIPEPLNFDLVRGLGARAGELEVNVLGAAHWDAVHMAPLELAPEIEWAPVDNLAVEAEAAIVGGRLVAFKFAVQGTRARPLAPGYLDGWQLLTRVADDGAGALAADVMGLYIGGLRFAADSPWSALVIAGVGGRWGGGPAPTSVSLLVNPSVFVDVKEWLTLGLETNLRATVGEPHFARLLPQVHLQISRRVRVQAGVGVDVDTRRRAAAGVAALRLIVERPRAAIRGRR